MLSWEGYCLLTCIITTEKSGILCCLFDPGFWFLTGVTVVFQTFPLNSMEGMEARVPAQASWVPDTRHWGLLCKTLTPTSLCLWSLCLRDWWAGFKLAPDYVTYRMRFQVCDDNRYLFKKKKKIPAEWMLYLAREMEVVRTVGMVFWKVEGCLLVALDLGWELYWFGDFFFFFLVCSLCLVN